MLHSIETTALRLAVMLKRSGKPRARVSNATFRKVSGRWILREAFVLRVQETLLDLDLVFFGLHRGGYALMSTSALEGAPPITVKKDESILDATDEEMWEELGPIGKEVDGDEPI